MLEIKEFVPDIDPRPIIMNCHMCGRFIHGSTKGYPADTHYSMPTNEVICEYCVRPWIKRYRISEECKDVLQDS